MGEWDFLEPHRIPPSGGREGRGEKQEYEKLRAYMAKEVDRRALITRAEHAHDCAYEAAREAGALQTVLITNPLMKEVIRLANLKEILNKLLKEQVPKEIFTGMWRIQTQEDVQARVRELEALAVFRKLR